MQLTAKLIQVLPLQSGMGKNGEWKKQDIIVETQEQYPKKICISLWGDKFGSVPLKVNDLYIIDFDVESREYNGRWYTDVKAWKMVAQSDSPSQQPQHMQEEYPPAPNPFEGNGGGFDDEVPF